MDIGDQFSLEHLIFKDRKCRVCGKVKSLMDDFYVTRKDRGTIFSAYSYECKQCTIERVKKSRAQKCENDNWQYPDW
jgi:hypothetical protein